MPRPKTLPAAAAEEADEPPADDVHIGRRLRHARLTHRLTLRQLAEQAECSESMLSKIENGRALPSMATLYRVIKVLGLTMGQLFTNAHRPAGIISRAGERAILPIHPLRPNSDTKVEQLIPYDPSHLLEGSIHLIAPGTGARTSDDLITHEGEEVGYVIEGTLEIIVGKERYTVNAGDSAHFRSEIPHGYFNPGPKPARIIVINTPPTF